MNKRINLFVFIAITVFLMLGIASLILDNQFKNKQIAILENTEQKSKSNIQILPSPEINFSITY